MTCHVYIRKFPHSKEGASSFSLMELEAPSSTHNPSSHSSRRASLIEAAQMAQQLVVQKVADAKRRLSLKREATIDMEDEVRKLQKPNRLRLD